jgi:hypothetical protein
MTMPNERPPARVAEPVRPSGDYSLHPLTTLDGVLIYASLNGETVGFFFGPSEEAAAEAVAVELRRRVDAGAAGTTR